MPERLLTFAEVAELLHVTERTVWNLKKRGHLAVVHVGRCVRVRPAALERYIEQRTQFDRRRRATP